MPARPFHRLTLRNPDRARALCLEPSGMVVDLDPGDEVVVELIGVDAPELDLIDDGLVVWGGVGSEVRVLRGDAVIYSTDGNPVPGVPDGMSVRDFIGKVVKE